MNFSLRTFAIASSLLAIFAFAYPHSSFAATTCTFGTDLTLGSESETVRCLQQYLNANGYTVSDSGAGAKGHETTQFKEKTIAAVKKWQAANGISPATGTFGVKSRAKYAALIAASTTPVVPTTPEPTTSPITSIPAPTSSASQGESNARSLLKSVQRAYAAAQDDYTTAHDNEDSTGNAKTYLEDARDSLMQAYTAFVNEDYASASTLATEAKKSVSDASDEIGGSSSESKDAANTAINNAKKSIQDAVKAVDAANTKGKNVSKADSYIGSAQSSLNDARDSYKTKDYADALSFVKDALSYVTKAKNAIK